MREPPSDDTYDAEESAQRFKAALPGEEARIRRHGEAVVLEPIAADWAWLDELAGELDEDFRRAAEEGPGDAPERPAVDRFFR